jgi:hypothetical protein
MTTDLTDALDAALERLRAGESVPAILARYPAQAEALIPLLNVATALETIRPVEMPPSDTLLVDRNDFLAEITRWQLEAVSPGPLMRLKGWIAHCIPWQLPKLTSQRKEQRRMSALLVKATLIFTMIFGSAGGAAALAAESLPGSPLYPAKLAMEQVRMDMARDPADQAALNLTLAQVRTQEMERVALAGSVPDDATLTRLQTHLNQTLRLAAQLPDDAMLGLLTQVRQMTQTQEQALQQAQTRAAEPAQEPLRQATRLLNQVRQDAEAGLQDPQTFRWRHTEGRPPEAPPQPTMMPRPGGVITPTTPISSPQRVGPCPTGNCEPAGDQNQYGPQPGQPGPGEPGGNTDGTCTDCKPAGDQNQYGPQPDQPGPGEPGGNPDGPCTDCEPAGDQNQNGPQPGQPGPGEPGGNPDGTCTDCEPAGDQNQYGPQPDQPGPGEPGGNPDGTCTDCEPAGDQNQYGPQPDQPGPGESGGNPDGTCTDCEPAGDQNQNQNGPQPEQGSGNGQETTPPDSPSSGQGGGQGGSGGQGGGGNR